MDVSKESAIRAELYLVLKNVIEEGVRVRDCKVTSPAVEYPVNSEKAKEEDDEK